LYVSDGIVTKCILFLPLNAYHVETFILVYLEISCEFFAGILLMKSSMLQKINPFYDNFVFSFSKINQIALDRAAFFVIDLGP